MILKEVDARWEQPDEKSHGKWGKLTRTERSVLSERRHSQAAKLHEVQGVGEEDAGRTMAAVEENPPKGMPSLPRKT
jgi:hypothetical protein